MEQDLTPRLGPDARLLLVGQWCGGRGPSDPRVRKLGYVEDLRPLYAAADIGLNPVTYGSGASVKVIEYLAAGLRVVSTAAGMRGYEQLSGRIHKAELGDFAAAIATLGLAPREIPREVSELTWSALGQQLHRTYTHLCNLTTEECNLTTEECGSARPRR